MANLFVFRHGLTKEDETLSKKGIEQAESAGEYIGDFLQNSFQEWLRAGRSGEYSNETFRGTLGFHSGYPRTKEFFELMYNSAKQRFGRLGIIGNNMSLENKDILDEDFGYKIIDKYVQILLPIAKIQLIVGHNPELAKFIKDYKDKNEFEFIGDSRFLRGTLQGGGYHINTLEKTINVINQDISE